MAAVYILFSKSINKFYTGSCKNLNDRIVHHQNKDFKKSYIRKDSDWELYVEIDNLEYQQARKIVKHIKAMKSKTYIQNLKKYPELVIKLIDKYK